MIFPSLSKTELPLLPEAPQSSAALSDPVQDGPRVASQASGPLRTLPAPRHPREELSGPRSGPGSWAAGADPRCRSWRVARGKTVDSGKTGTIRTTDPCVIGHELGSLVSVRDLGQAVEGGATKASCTHNHYSDNCYVSEEVHLFSDFFLFGFRGLPA